MTLVQTFFTRCNKLFYDDVCYTQNAAGNVATCFPTGFVRLHRVENPCVGGSIPPQATRFKKYAPMCFLKTTQVVTCGNSSVGRAIPCQGIGREFEPLFPLHVLCVKSPSTVMGFLLSGAAPAPEVSQKRSGVFHQQDHRTRLHGAALADRAHLFGRFGFHIHLVN
jgi:hypothetical protein